MLNIISEFDSVLSHNGTKYFKNCHRIKSLLFKKTLDLEGNLLFSPKFLIVSNSYRYLFIFMASLWKSIINHMP